MKVPIKKILFYSGMVLLGLVVVFLVCRVLLNLDALGNTVRGIFGSLRAIVLGCVMAYLLYPLTRFSEQFLLYHKVRKTVRSEVDFVLTFEEMSGIFAAKDLDLENMHEDADGVNDVSTDGRNFAVSGGVAQAVVDVIKKEYPDKEIKIANAEGLEECRKLMMLASKGKYNGY